MSGLIDALLPEALAPEMAAVELYLDPPGLQPLDAEAPLVAKSVAKRRNEFVTVRHCARQALAQLGVAPAPILKGDKGQPCWPEGIVGSLTHCTGFRGAVVGRSGPVRAVGIDAEPHAPLPDGVLGAVSLPLERAALTVAAAGAHWDRILFCAKEATYKAWFPLTHRWLGFEDAHITFRAEVFAAGAPISGSFSSQILIDPAAEFGPPLHRLDGRWAVSDGLVLAVIVL